MMVIPNLTHTDTMLITNPLFDKKRQLDIERTAVIDGEEVEYDECSEECEDRDNHSWEYLGSGTIYRINTCIVDDDRLHHFWIFK